MKYFLIPVFGSLFIFCCLRCAHHTPHEHSFHTPGPDTLLLQQLDPYYEKLAEPKPGDWLSVYPESGQSLFEYRAGNPVIVDSIHRVIYLLPLGSFDSLQEEIINKTAAFLRAFFNVPVNILNAKSLGAVPQKFRRGQQIKTRYILQNILEPLIPSDALGVIAITPADLFPDSSWKFGFGEADPQHHTAVSSIYRYGDIHEKKTAYDLCLRRLLGTTAHECCHMFGMDHCIHFACVLNGSNSLNESDGKPVYLCPECLLKLDFSTHQKPIDYYKRLDTFFMGNGFIPEKEFCDQILNILEPVYHYPIGP